MTITGKNITRTVSQGTKSRKCISLAFKKENLLKIVWIKRFHVEYSLVYVVGNCANQFHTIQIFRRIFQWLVDGLYKFRCLIRKTSSKSEHRFVFILKIILQTFSAYESMIFRLYKNDICQKRIHLSKNYSTQIHTHSLTFIVE